ncbi:MAG TPA: hypothetical protein DEF45_21970 [Rhodopirellula sp.]|nr:hypothetical protein [Rhodopirellula sp.]
MGASRLLKSGAKKRKTDLPLNGAIQWKPVTLNQNAGAEVLRRLNIDGGRIVWLAFPGKRPPDLPEACEWSPRLDCVFLA